MTFPTRNAPPPLPCQTSKVQLVLRTPHGDRWGLTLSCGMERFIGQYSRVPGLASDGPLLRYNAVDVHRRG